MSRDISDDFQYYDDYRRQRHSSGRSESGGPAHDFSNRDDASSGGYGGKYKSSRRAERVAHAAPYHQRAPRYASNNNSSSNNNNAPEWQEYSPPRDDTAAPPSESVASQRVYVGNLSWGVTWQMLKDHMRSAGVVLHVDILKVGGRSKGCGVVTFAAPSDADAAVAQLNNSVLDGRTIFVRHDREDRRVRPSTGCRVYVGNLAWNVKWQDLKDHMKQIGTVVYADVLEDATGRSKGCGLVEYATRAEALHAIDTLTNSTLGDRAIYVREDRDPDAGSISDIARRTRNSDGYSDGGGPTGLGGVLGGPPAPYPNNMEYYPAAPPSFHHPPPPPHHPAYAPVLPPPYAAMPVPPPPVYGGSGGGAIASGERQIFIGNLPLDTHWKSLKDLFRTVGPVERAEVPEYPNGQARGFGLVRFYDPQHAWQAIERYDRAEVNGRIVTVRLDRSGK